VDIHVIHQSRVKVVVREFEEKLYSFQFFDLILAHAEHKRDVTTTGAMLFGPLRTHKSKVTALKRKKVCNINRQKDTPKWIKGTPAAVSKVKSLSSVMKS